MLHLLIDALSVNNLSGCHVLLGHLRQLAMGITDQYRLSLIASKGNKHITDEIPCNVVVLDERPPSDWRGRYAWARFNAHRLSRKCHIDLVFSPSGMLGPGWDRPQVVLAQNPWPLTRAIHRGPRDHLKALAQRWGFRDAQHHAVTMVFNSDFMKQLYERNFGPARADVIAYQGIDLELLTIGARAAPIETREPTVLTVSVMAPHKNVESLVSAFARVRRCVEGAQLKIVGQWPNSDYRREIEMQVSRLGLQGSVSFLGHVDRPTLNELYAGAKLFCMFSRCESFGIPAIEAQTFGTPTIVCEGTAAPEVAGAGGFVVPVDDPGAAADVMVRILTDSAAATEASERARFNAKRFEWSEVSAPLVESFETLARRL